ncbi:MAG: AI-2E family transporter [Vicinamibacterales bacterium]
MANQDPRRIVLFAIGATAAAVLLLWTLYLVREQLLLVYVSGLFATGLAPLVRMIERQRLLRIGKRHLPRLAAILVIYVTVLALAAAVVAAMLPPLIEQGQQLWTDLPSKIDQLQQQLITWGVLPKTVTLGEFIQRAPTAGGTNAVTTILLALWSVAGGLFGFVSILLLTFYMLVESQAMFDVFLRLFDRRQRERVKELSARVSLKVSAWLGGQMFLGLIIGITSAIGLALLGVPYFYVLAVICGIGEMIPMVGPLVAAVPAIAVALTVSPGLALAVAAFFMAQQALENNLLVPKVLGKQVGLSAVTVIIALAIGTELLGIVGALLAVPTAGILQVLIEEVMLREDVAG